MTVNFSCSAIVFHVLHFATTFEVRREPFIQERRACMILCTVVCSSFDLRPLDLVSAASLFVTWVMRVTGRKTDGLEIMCIAASCNDATYRRITKTDLVLRAGPLVAVLLLHDNA